MTDVNTGSLRMGRDSSSPAPLAFGQLITRFRRHVRLFVGVFVAVALIVILLAISSAPRFTSTATVVIDQHDQDALHINSLTPQDALTPAYQADSSAVDTEAKIIESPALAGQVVDQLHLEQDPEFNAALHRPGLIARIKASLTGGAVTDPQLAQQQEREGVINAVLRGLTVKRAEMTYAIDVAYTAFEADKAAAIVNAFTQRYLAQQLEAKFDESSRGTQFLNSKLGELRQNVETANAAVQQYKIANDLLSAQGATLTEQQVSTLQMNLSQARAQDAEQDAKLATAEHQIAAGSAGDDTDAAMSNPVLQALRAQRAQASAQLADLQSRYGDKYTAVIKAKNALADIDAQIHTEVQRTLSNLRAQSQVGHSRTAEVAAQVNSTRAVLANNNRAMARLTQLQSDADTAQSIYAAFLERYKEALAKEGNQQADARVVSAGQLPTEPSAPNKPLAVALGVILGFIAAAAAAIAAELTSRGVSNTQEAEQNFGLPCMAELPTLASTRDSKTAGRQSKDPRTFVVQSPLSRFAEAFRSLRATLALSRASNPPRLVAITSSLPGEGKTTTAICLARTAALSGQRVILVDGDLRQRSVSKILPDKPSVGLLEVLSGSATLDEAIVRDPETAAFVLPLTDSSFSPRDVFGSPAMLEVLQGLKTRFDLVIIDTAPVLALADTTVLCTQMDAVLFLTRWRKTSRSAVRAALRSLEAPNIPLAGLVLTQVDVRVQARHGEGAARYYKEYAKYYAE